MTKDMSFWDERYKMTDYLYGESPNDFLVESTRHIKTNGEILCLLEGEGRNATFLAMQGFSVTAVDSSRIAKEKAIKLAMKNHVEITYFLSDINAFDLGERKWDAIISIFAHIPSPAQRSLHQKALKALNPEGIFILEGYNYEQLKFKTGGPQDKSFLFVKEDIEHDFKGGEFLISQNVYRSVVEGIGHTGDSSVYQLIVKPNKREDIL